MTEPSYHYTLDRDGRMALRREMANPHLGGSVGLFQQIPTNPRRTP